MIVRDMPEETYHARPELSSTQARLLLESAAKYRYAIDHPQKPKRAFDVGSAAHTKILGIGSDVVEYPEEHLTPSGNVSTKAATLAWAEEKRAGGLIPVSPDDVAAVNGMAESILAHPEARERLERAGDRELSVFADVEGIPSRARLDGLAGDAFDVKTTRKTAEPVGFSREAIDHGYHVQEAWYRDVLKSAGVEFDRFLFFVVESTAPYLAGVIELDVIFQDMGRVAAIEARKRYRRGVETGQWPGYSERIELASPPAWAAMLSEEMYGQEIGV